MGGPSYMGLSAPPRVHHHRRHHHNHHGWVWLALALAVTAAAWLVIAHGELGLLIAG